MQPDFLESAEVLYIYADQIDRYGGASSVRDPGLLEAAVAMPRAAVGGEFLHRDLFEMAAAYLFHIVQNHPFVDGNKRTGAATSLVFLDLNGVEIDADEDALVDLVRAVAQGAADKQRIAEFFRANHT